MPASFRLIRLVVLARLRAAGWAPWLLVAGWLLVASYQEPLLFRRYGIHLVDDAAWTGGLVVLLVLLLAEGRMPGRCSALANLVMLFGMAVVQAIGSYLADQSPWITGWDIRAIGALSFLMSWAPLSIALSSNSGSSAASRLSRIMVVLAAGLLGSMQAVALRTSPDTLVLLASALASAGAACWASGRPNNT